MGCKNTRAKYIRNLKIASNNQINEKDLENMMMTSYCILIIDYS